MPNDALAAIMLRDSTRLTADVASEVFSALPRADQRKKAVMYMNGLLQAPARKSARNIAAFLGPEVNAQSLHHFINASTWEWAPVREKLGHYVACHASPQAWVLQPVIIPKAGSQSAGVSRIFYRESGHSVTAQQAIGVWAASSRITSPLNWWLHLPRAEANVARGGLTSIPNNVSAETLEESVAFAYLETVLRHHLPELPVVLNAQWLDCIRVVAKLRAAGIPQISRVDKNTRLLLADPALPGRDNESLQAIQIARLIKTDPSRLAIINSQTAYAELMAAVRIHLPVTLGTPGEPDGTYEFLLLGVGPPSTQWPTELWLTDLSIDHADKLFEFILFGRSVERDGMRRAEQIGIRDFVGRSFSGWHRHATIVSVAHLLAELGARRD